MRSTKRSAFVFFFLYIYNIYIYRKKKQQGEYLPPAPLSSLFTERKRLLQLSTVIEVERDLSTSTVYVVEVGGKKIL